MPQGVSAAEAHPHAAETFGVDGRLRGQRASGDPEIFQLAGRVLVLARVAAAGSEVAVIED